MNLNLILSHLSWTMLFSFLLAAFIARVAIPPIVRVSKTKNLLSKTSSRSSHEGRIPYLGGIAIFASLAISSSLFARHGLNPEFQFILPAMLIIFFIGMKDDIVSINPITKLGGQILASMIVIVGADVRIASFHGILGIHELGVMSSIAFSLLVFLALINAFNLIDGIDGLASGLGIQISLVFGFWLAFLQQHDYAVLAFAMAGGLIPFYIYNVFSKKYKLFMGDTGSLLIGLVFSILAMKILSFKLPTTSSLYAPSLPVLVACVMIIPIADTIRIFVFRMARGRSPLHADKNHFHHYLLGLNMSHWQASSIIVILNTLLFLLAFILRDFGNILLGIIVFGLAWSIMMIIRLILRKSLVPNP